MIDLSKPIYTRQETRLISTSPGWNALKTIAVLHPGINFAATHFYTQMRRGSKRVKSLVQKTQQSDLTMAQTRTSWSRDQPLLLTESWSLCNGPHDHPSSILSCLCLSLIYLQLNLQRCLITQRNLGLKWWSKNIVLPSRKVTRCGCNSWKPHYKLKHKNIPRRSRRCTNNRKWWGWGQWIISER